MNRKQRRAAEKTASGTAATPSAAADLFQRALQHQDAGQFADAARLYKRVLSLTPAHSATHNNLACVLLAQGKRADASQSFAHAIEASPELLDDLSGILTILRDLLPALATATQRADAAWPHRTGIDAAFGTDFAGVATDPLLLTVLTTTTLRDMGMERLFTGLRRDVLARALTLAAGDMQQDRTRPADLDFFGALAQQCFINEYVFAQTPDEETDAAALCDRLAARLHSGAPVAGLTVLALAMYMPLGTLTDIESIAAKPWPKPVRDVIAQQVSELRMERALRATIATLTPIADDVSTHVRDQYEENPYPRWVRAAAPRPPVPLEQQLRSKFPAARLHPLRTETPDVLIAGCGTGRHAIELAQSLPGGGAVLAIDLSRTSLGYAKRKTPRGLSIDYAQADILGLDALGRSFDLISASGVLHHMADPLAGWRILTALLRPQGVMHLGLYSETARRPVTEARALIAEHGYRATSDDIRRARLTLAERDHPITRWGDFFSMSDCRDLLFHVQEHRFTIAQIKAALDGFGLRFLGFELSPRDAQLCRDRFERDRWSATDLDHWQAMEAEHPDLFTGMYQFWVQKG
jgi:SAM-dependent methyltransferase